jgi:hypothetical protein
VKESLFCTSVVKTWTYRHHQRVQGGYQWVQRGYQRVQRGYQRVQLAYQTVQEAYQTMQRTSASIWASRSSGGANDVGPWRNPRSVDSTTIARVGASRGTKSPRTMPCRAIPLAQAICTTRPMFFPRSRAVCSLNLTAPEACFACETSRTRPTESTDCMLRTTPSLSGARRTRR